MRPVELTLRLALPVAAILVGCGKKSTTSDVLATGTVTPEDGGAIATSDGKLSLSFPPGAVDASVEITVRTVPAPSVFVGSVVYRLEPSGLTFATPIQVTRTVPLVGLSVGEAAQASDDAGRIEFDGGFLSGASSSDAGPPVLLPFIASDGSVEPLIDASVTIDSDAGTATVVGGVSHFSDSFVTQGPLSVSVTPARATMNVGDAQEFAISLSVAKYFKAVLGSSFLDILTFRGEPVDVATPNFIIEKIDVVAKEGRVTIDTWGTGGARAWVRCVSAGPDEVSFFVRGRWRKRDDGLTPYDGPVVVKVSASVLCLATLPSDGGSQTIDGDGGADAGTDAGVDAGGDAGADAGPDGGDPTFCTWFPVVTIPTFGGTWCDTPTILMGSGGAQFAIWHQDENGAGVARLSTRVDGGAWSDAGTVTTGGGSGAVWDCSGAALPDGRVIIAWTQQDGANDKVYARFRLANGTLTTPVVISGGNNAPLNPKVVVTGVGKIVVTMSNINSPNKVWSNTYDDDAGTWVDAGVVGGGALPQAAVGAAGEVGLLFGFSESPNMGTRSAFFTVGGGWLGEETLTTSTTSSGYAGAVAWNDATDQFVAITGIDQSFVIRMRANAAGSWSGTSTFWTPPGGGAVDEIRVAYDPSGNGAALWSWCPVYKSCDVYANVFAAGSGWKTPRQLDHSEHQSSVVMSLAHKAGVNAFFMAGWRQGTSGSTANIRASQIGVAGTFSAAETLGANQMVSAFACDDWGCAAFSTASSGCTLPTWICK